MLINLQNMFFDSPVISFVILTVIFFINLIGIFVYRKIAVKRAILANPNFRALHEISIPRGGGIIFGLIFVVGVILLWLFSSLSNELLFIYGLGGFAATLLGIIDDINDIGARKKLAMQIIICLIPLLWLYDDLLLKVVWIPSWVIIPVALLFLVWMINAYNFMDGVDGIAASGAIFSSGVIAISLIIMNGPLNLVLLLLLLMISVMTFLIFNWPPASIFMGDSGSVFLGYIFGVLILYTTINDYVSIWTWIIVFGYFIADTSLTLIARLFLVKKWYGAHRSHAYQNIARITSSHLKVTLSVVIYNLVWLLPLAILSVIEPNMAIFSALMAILPALVVSYKYGPLLSSA